MCICVCAKPWRWCRSNSVFISFYLNSTRLPHAFEQLSLLEERKKEGGLPPPPNSISFWVSILPEFFNYEKRIFVLYYSKQDENILLIWDVLLGMIWGGGTLCEASSSHPNPISLEILSVHAMDLQCLRPNYWYSLNSSKNSFLSRPFFSPF